MLFLFFSSLHSLASEQICRFDSLPTQSIDENGNKNWVFLEKDKPVFWQEATPEPGPLYDLNTFVTAHTDVNQTYLLQKQRAIFNRHISRNMEELDQLYGDLAEQRMGNIKNISCLESLLYELQLSEHSFKTPTEFCAAIYKLEIANTPYIKIIFASGRQASGPDMTPQLLKENRPVFAFMHNHIFVFDNNTGDIAGTVIPSGLTPPNSFFDPASDLKYYRQIAQRHGLTEAWITNGFHTSHFKILDKTGQGLYWIY